jgi:diguanylate cyclase
LEAWVELIEERLRTAVEQGELRLVYQPIVDLRDGSITAVEALLRWSPDGLSVPPSDFGDSLPAGSSAQ